MNKERKTYIQFGRCLPSACKGILVLSAVLSWTMPAANLTAATYYVNSATGSDVTGDGSSGNSWETITYAISQVSDSDTINCTGTFTGEGSATTGIAVNKGITIVGQGEGATFVQAASSAGAADRRVFTISSGKTVGISMMTIRYGNVAGGDGGGIYNPATATLSVTDCTISANSTGDDGGGIYNPANAALKDNMHKPDLLIVSSSNWRPLVQ